MMIWWLFIGLLLGVLALKLWEYAQKQGLKFRWWQVALMLIWVAWTALGVLFVVESFAEYEPRSAWIFLLVFGFISVIGAVLMARNWFFPKLEKA